MARGAGAVTAHSLALVLECASVSASSHPPGPRRYSDDTLRHSDRLPTPHSPHQAPLSLRRPPHFRPPLQNSNDNKNMQDASYKLQAMQYD